MSLQTFSTKSIQNTLSAHRNHSFAALFSNVFWAIARTLMARDEIKVSIQQLRNGEQIWHVYDPMIGRTESFLSEIEALRWIEGKTRHHSAIEN